VGLADDDLVEYIQHFLPADQSEKVLAAIQDARAGLGSSGPPAESALAIDQGKGKDRANPNGRSKKGKELASAPETEKGGNDDLARLLGRVAKILGST
jgi:hypothetical protein